MPSAPGDIEAAEELISERSNPKDVLRKSFIKGLAILLPLLVTLFVLSFVLGFVFQQLNPVATAVVQVTPFQSEIVVAASTVVLFLLLVVGVGSVAEYGTENDRLSDQFNEFMASIPGLGSVYTSFNEMSELLLDSDTDSFQDVKLVEYPGKDSYVVAFKTAETPEVVAEDTGNEEMITLFMPMAPNPVMGGFVIHVSTDRVVDVDLTVEQGIRSIVTSGVAFGEGDGGPSGLSEQQLRQLNAADTDGESPLVDDSKSGEELPETEEMTDTESRAADIDAEDIDDPVPSTDIDADGDSDPGDDR
jgi:uncharacterized membrane protein